MASEELYLQRRWHWDEAMLSRVSAPATGLVTLSLVKSALRIATSDEDAFLTHLINTVSSFLDGPHSRTGRCYINQSWKLQVRDPEERIYLAGAPVTSVDLIQYRDTNGDLQTYSLSNVSIYQNHEAYYVEANVGQMWPTGLLDRPDAFQVTYTSGLGASESSVPANVQQAALLLIGHYYENREAVTLTSSSNFPKELALGVDSLIADEKLGWVGS